MNKNLKNNMSIFNKKYLRDWAWVFTGLTLVFGAVIFPGLSDYANKPFWWHLWEVLGIACALTTIGLWVYGWTKQDGKK